MGWRHSVRARWHRAGRHRTTTVVSTIAVGESIAIVLISSPARVHPSTDMTWRTLGTTCMLDGLDRCPIQIVCDGYRTPTDLEASHAARILPQLERDPAALSKKGIVRGDLGDAYEKYKAQLHIDIAERGLSERVSVEELGSHHGFAMCVRHALERCDRRFALIMQHDRCFIRGLATHDLARILATFDEPTLVRYVGFPSSTSKRLATRLAPKYKLGPLLAQRSRELRPGLCLRPSNFWFDSNHIVHAERALAALFAPLEQRQASMPLVLAKRLGAPGPLYGDLYDDLHGTLRRLTLRVGDFIEDRFGTEQRALLSRLHDDPALCLQAFDWTGCYLLEETVERGGTGGRGGSLAASAADEDWSERLDTALLEGTVEDHFCDLLDSRGRATFVAHIDARGAVPREWSRGLPLLQGHAEPQPPGAET